MKPFKIYIPEYLDKIDFDGVSLILEKTKSLLDEDNNKVQYLISLESIENYHCDIKQIGNEYSEMATNAFNRDRENQGELPIKINNCSVYTFYWDDKMFHFRIYWIVISEKYMLRLVGIFRPEYSEYYKFHLMRYFQAIEIDTSFDFSQPVPLDKLIETEKVAVSVDDLKSLIAAKKQSESDSLFSEENLKVSNSDFYTILRKELEERNEAKIESFICKDWNVYYELYNPENFSDPDSKNEWEDNSDVFEFYEKPFKDNLKTAIYCDNKDIYLDSLKQLIENESNIERDLLSAFEHYTFGNGGAYAEGIHYKWAKIEIERLHGQTYTNSEFLKRNLRLEMIELLEEPNKLKLHFNCSWDSEHGVEILVLDGAKLIFDS